MRNEQQPANPTRRRFLSFTAGGAVAAMAITTAQAGAQAPKMAMAAAVTDLDRAFALLTQAKRVYDAAEDEAEDWEARNPQPSSKRGKRRWLKRAAAEREKLVSQPWQGLMQAEADFSEAQEAVAAVPVDSIGDLQAKAACALRYDGVEVARINRAPISRAIMDVVFAQAWKAQS